jgi:guanylate kinase
MELDAKYLITISGKSLSGKTTLGRLLEATGDFVEVKSHTTRLPRPGEVYGDDYYFVSEAAFDVMEVCNELVGTTRIGDYRYGTSYSVLERAVASNKVPFAITDPEGPRFLKPWCDDSGITLVAIWRHVDQRSQYHRWFKRTIEDDRNIDDSIERLVGIVDKEPIWVDQWNWDLILPQQTQWEAVETVNAVRDAVGLQPMLPEWEIPQGIFKEN